MAKTGNDAFDTYMLRNRVAIAVVDAARETAKSERSDPEARAVLEGMWLAMQSLAGPREAAEVIRYSLLIDCDK